MGNGDHYDLCCFISPRAITLMILFLVYLGVCAILVLKIQGKKEKKWRSSPMTWKGMHNFDS